METSDLIAKVISCFESLDIPYFITGSIASILYGEPRFTHDIDIVADIREDHIEGLQKCFPEKQFYFDHDAVRNALRHRFQFNIIHPASGLKADVFLPKDTQFDRNRFDRCRRMKISDNQHAFFASPEDVILMKLRYYREGGSDKHLRDIQSILDISGAMIDIPYLENWINRLGLMAEWKKISKSPK